MTYFINNFPRISFTLSGYFGDPDCDCGHRYSWHNGDKECSEAIPHGEYDEILCTCKKFKRAT